MKDPSALKTLFFYLHQRVNCTSHLPAIHNFLLHSASSVPLSSNIYPKYLNSDTCFSCSPSNVTSHRGLSSLTTITSLLSNTHILTHILPNLSTNPLKLSSDSLHNAKSSTYNRYGTYLSLPFSIILTPSPATHTFNSFITQSIYKVNNQGDIT